MSISSDVGVGLTNSDVAFQSWFIRNERCRVRWSLQMSPLVILMFTLRRQISVTSDIRVHLIVYGSFVLVERYLSSPASRQSLPRHILPFVVAGDHFNSELVRSRTFCRNENKNEVIEIYMDGVHRPISIRNELYFSLQ